MHGLTDLHIVLYEPEIPPNTGTIIRLAAITGAQLHLIHPLGFAMDEKPLRRAGLDYHEFAAVKEHDCLADFVRDVQPNRMLGLSTKGEKSHVEFEFERGDAVVMGPESRGLPEDVRHSLNDVLRIPMLPERRSLNLANATSVVVYEVWRQWGFC